MTDEPCNRFGGCPYLGKVPRESRIFFCPDCMEEMSITGRYRERTIDEIRAGLSKAKQAPNPIDRSQVAWGSDEI
jgi:hypothetical protein